MKKIFNILFAVSLFAVACTTEVPVSRDHDINAEVVEMQTKEEISMETVIITKIMKSNYS